MIIWLLWMLTRHHSIHLLEKLLPNVHPLFFIFKRIVYEEIKTIIKLYKLNHHYYSKSFIHYTKIEKKKLDIRKNKTNVSLVQVQKESN